MRGVTAAGVDFYSRGHGTAVGELTVSWLCAGLCYASGEVVGSGGSVVLGALAAGLADDGGAWAHSGLGHGIAQGRGGPVEGVVQGLAGCARGRAWCWARRGRTVVRWMACQGLGAVQSMLCGMLAPWSPGQRGPGCARVLLALSSSLGEVCRCCVWFPNVSRCNGSIAGCVNFFLQQTLWAAPGRNR